MTDRNLEPLPLFGITESHVVITADGQWSEYYNNSATATDGGTWTVVDGRLILDPYHAVGWVGKDKLQLEWGFRDVYNYRRVK